MIEAKRFDQKRSCSSVGGGGASDGLQPRVRAQTPRSEKIKASSHMPMAIADVHSANVR
jgi:hypothetical protein